MRLGDSADASEGAGPTSKHSTLALPHSSVSVWIREIKYIRTKHEMSENRYQNILAPHNGTANRVAHEAVGGSRAQEKPPNHDANVELIK